MANWEVYSNYFSITSRGILHTTLTFVFYFVTLFNYAVNRYIYAGKAEAFYKKTRPSTNVSTTNRLWLALGLNKDLRNVFTSCH
jgi:hypothetical protein